jgi:hypothetical protein
VRQARDSIIRPRLLYRQAISIERERASDSCVSKTARLRRDSYHTATPEVRAILRTH